MSALSFFWHIANFLALPLFMAVVLPLTTWPWQRGIGFKKLCWQALALFFLSLIVLIAGIVLTRVDGKLSTYLILILACGLFQYWSMNKNQKNQKK